MVSSVSGANGTDVLLMLGFGLHRHQQGEFLFFGHLLSGLQLGFSDVMCIDACDPQSGSMDTHHDRKRLGARLPKDGLQHPHDEFLCGVVVVVKEYAPHPRALELLLVSRLGQDRVTWRALSTHIVIVPRALAVRRSCSIPRPLRCRGQKSLSKAD